MAASGLTLQPSPVEDFRASASRHSMDPCALASKSILVFVRFMGPESQLLALELCQHDIIASIKIQTQVRRGLYVDKQKVVYGANEFSRDERRLLDYGVNNDDERHLVLRLRDLNDISVKTVDGSTLVYKVGRTGSVGDLRKCILEGKRSSPGDQFRMLRGERPAGSISIKELPLVGNAALCLVVLDRTTQFRNKWVGKGNLELEFDAAESLSQSECVADCKEFDEGAEIQLGSSVRPQLKVFNDSVQAYSSIRRANFHFSGGHSKVFSDLLESVEKGLVAGQSPKLSSEGSGGVYFMQDEYGSRNVAVFKPRDEEPMAVNNPRGFSLPFYGEGLKRGTRSGEGDIREVAAYILDHCAQGLRRRLKEDEDGFAGVPPTALVECYHEVFNYSTEDRKVYRRAKVGSLQQFVPSLGSCEDMGSSLFPVEEVHKITVLDLRLANTDRNGGNILVCKGEGGALKLVPIDHGYCFPDKFEECTFEWMYWPQASQTYGLSALQYINSLDAEHDIALLRQCGWKLRPQCARVLRVSTMVLKKGAAAGLTPFQIGSIISRGGCLDSKSPIELMLEKAESMRRPNTKEADFLKFVEGLLDAYVARVNPP